MKTSTHFLALMSIVPTCEARLGDTPATVAERYGQAVQVFRDVKGRTGHIHRSDGYVVLVEYLDGISQSEVYAKPNDDALTESEIQTLLRANASSDKWQEIPAATVHKAAGPGWRGWTILRTRALSAYGPSIINETQYRHALSVGTRAYNEKNKALDAKRSSEPIFAIPTPPSTPQPTTAAPAPATPPDPDIGLDSTGISPSPGFIYADTLTGAILRSSATKDIGEQITFIGLTTSNPRVAFSGTGGTSPMKVMAETAGLITIQLFTGHSIDTFIIDKRSGIFSRSYRGTSLGQYAGASIGRCK
jgi:hypothetical protein